MDEKTTSRADDEKRRELDRKVKYLITSLINKKKHFRTII